MEKTTKKRVLSWINFILSAAIFALALYVFITSVSARSHNDRAEIFGYSFAIVATGSMYPEIKVGDLIIVKSCDITEIAEGQNAVFIGLSGEFKDKSIVHKVIAIEPSSDGTGIQLRTQGVNNDFEDDDPVTAANFIGREIFHSTVLGVIVTFLQNPLNWVYLLVFVLAISFVVMQSVKVARIIKNKNKKETTEQIAEEEQLTNRQIENNE